MREKDDDDMFKIKKISISLIMILAVGLVIGLSATASFGQRPDRKANPTIKLKKNAKKNGYKIRLSDGVIYAQANNVIDLDGILLEGLRRILYRCTKDSEYLIREEVQFISGRSDEVELECGFTDGFQSGDMSVWSSVSTSTTSQIADEEERKIILEKNKKVNGYKVVEGGEGDFYVNIIGVTNPLTGKKLDGTYDLVYRCANVAAFITVSVILAKGYARQKLQCYLEPKPDIFY